MKDAGDDNSVRFDNIEDAVAAVDDTANAMAISGPFFPDQWKVFEPGKNPVNSALILGGRSVSEPVRTIGIDFGKVRTCRFAQPDFNHAARVAQR